MKIKFSHIALAVIASSSFSALAAETLVAGAGKSVTAEENIIVTDTSTLGLTITAIPDLTVAKVKQGKETNVAKFKVTGSNVAIRMVNAHPKDKYCSVLTGDMNPKNTMEVCMKESKGGFDIGADRYYKFNEGEHFLRSSDSNITINNAAADSYKVTMEAAQYVL